MGGGSLNRSDIYGGMSAANGGSDPIYASGPNQSSVASPTAIRESSGVGAAASWIGFVVLLVAIRILSEYA